MTTDSEAVRAVLHDAVGRLMCFVAGTASAEDTVASLTHGLESLAFHRENVRRTEQPELDLEMAE